MGVFGRTDSYYTLSAMQYLEFFARFRLDKSKHERRGYRKRPYPYGKTDGKDCRDFKIVSNNGENIFVRRADMKVIFLDIDGVLN